ncbi:NADPH:quinone reductase-like Zn-dependent oxidoreductase [Pseudonocardia eucalypti]|uniref:zinc-binding dehydrogenase n=1 Tax=Pseudonocardia eucalypti TaxID=648755 RepID=UPI0017A665AC|nr:NADPH:quinone reductase-like Zn-dependent oxidoreductase [Pseudonocardia eucalypti]
MGGPEVLRIEELPVRAPGAGEVRLRVDAIGLNRAEVNFRRGTYLEAPRLPAGLGSEAAGEVLETGDGVTAWRPGDQVSVVPVFSQNDYPVYAEEAVVPAAALLARPAGMDAVTGAATWMPYLTVYGMVQEVARVRPGDHVLLTGASNSIGMAAIQVVRHLGAIPLVTAPGAAQCRALLDAGAAVALADETAGDDLVSSVRDATGGRGADLVLDAIGGPNVEALVRATAPGGAVIVHGGLSGQPTPLPAGRYAPVWMRRYTVFEITGNREALRRGECFVRAGLASGAFAPHIDRVFEFDDVAEAHVYLDSPDRAPGKPVLRVR